MELTSIVHNGLTSALLLRYFLYRKEKVHTKYVFGAG
jgi:hypothetical protein